MTSTLFSIETLIYKCSVLLSSLLFLNISREMAPTQSKINSNWKIQLKLTIIWRICLDRPKYNFILISSHAAQIFISDISAPRRQSPVPTAVFQSPRTASPRRTQCYVRATPVGFPTLLVLASSHHWGTSSLELLGLLLLLLLLTLEEMVLTGEDRR